MKILAVDLGDARTGLACCDKNETLAAPLSTIFETNQKKLLEKIIKQIETLQIETVVVGNPINMDGSLGPRSNKCGKFATKLQQSTKIPVVLWDERQTTIMANRIMTTLKTKKKTKN